MDQLWETFELVYKAASIVSEAEAVIGGQSMEIYSSVLNIFVALRIFLS